MSKISINKKWCLRTLFAVIVLFLAARPSDAEIPEPEIEQTPSHVLTLDSIAALPQPLFPKIWQVYAAPGVIVDNNINHLLINSSINSNIRVRDEAAYINAGAILKPDWGRTFVPYFNYDFERYDYQNNTDFSYYDQRLYGSLNTWFMRHLALDLGLEAMWFADTTGLVNDDQTLHSGLRWENGPWRGRTGYAVRRDRFQFSPGKDGSSDIGYVELSRNFLRNHSWFTSYYYRSDAAGDPIFAYHSHYGELGWVGSWNSRFKTVLMGTALAKQYVGFDDRFGARRLDHTYTMTLKPSWALYPSLRLVGSYSYQVNYSNVDVKHYYDQLFSLFLEARL